MELSESEAKGSSKARRKKALLALFTFHKRLVSQCGRFETANQWYDFVKKNVKPLIEMYEDDLPPDIVEKLGTSSQLVDTSRDGINQTCDLLQHDVLKAAKGKAAHHPMGKWILGTALVGVAAVSGMLIYLKQTAVTITVKNDGCAPIMVTGSVPLKLPGVTLPESIPSGSTATITAPPLTATIDATNGETIIVSTLGVNLSFALQQGISITFDDMDLIGNRTTINLGDANNHDVVISCRS